MKLGSVLDLPELATPGSPATGRHAVYVKSDGNLYIKDSGGTEHPAAIVTSVAGLTGAVVLTESDIVHTRYTQKFLLGGM